MTVGGEYHGSMYQSGQLPFKKYRALPWCLNTVVNVTNLKNRKKITVRAWGAVGSGEIKYCTNNIYIRVYVFQTLKQKSAVRHAGGKITVRAWGAVGSGETPIPGGFDGTSIVGLYL